MALRARPLIHAVDPYRGLDVSDWEPDLRGWGSEHPVFQRVLASVEARDILEIGSWKGASAIHMGRLQERFGRADTEIVCVDTWLGSLEFLTDHSDDERYRALGHCNGYPTVYWTFLHNVAALGLTSVITPFPITSAIAARFCKHFALKFDVIYVDGSHTYEDVSSDLSAYWPLVRPGGVMFGDDYSRNWPEVMQAVDDFAGASAIEIVSERWILRRSR